MSAVEEIQGAIDKLTRLQSLGSDGEWRFTERSGVAAVTNEVGRGVAHHVPSPDAALIVTLHATIDAQLLILRNGSNSEADGPISEAGRAYDAIALILARAINGGTK